MAEDTERAERLARALGWADCTWGAACSRTLTGGHCFVDRGGYHNASPPTGWSIVPAVIEAIEAKGWDWTRGWLDGGGYKISLYPNPDATSRIGHGRATDFPTALIDAFTAACEAQEGNDG